MARRWSRVFPTLREKKLRRLRPNAGAYIPHTIRMLPNPNLTDAMVRLADVAVPFRTYPHVDMKEAGARAATLLIDRISRGRPWERTFRRLDFWIPLGAQCTLMPPMQTVMLERTTIAERSDVVELAFCFGFPYADFLGCGPALAVWSDSKTGADAAANEMLDFLNAQEQEFTQELLPSDAAVAEARRPRHPALGQLLSRTHRTIQVAAVMAIRLKFFRNWYDSKREGRCCV